MKRILRNISIVLAAIFICTQCSVTALAYFDRGNVSISAGKQSVTLEQGNSEKISITLSPASSSQLPGCGMAECPQSCGEKECLDANGECQCNGTTYQTYYATASASSNNTSVATASYDNGVVTIKGVGAGTATITLTASLRQYTSTSTSIQVTVNSKSSSGGSGNGGANQGSSGSGNEGTNQGSSGSGNGSSNQGSSGSSTNKKPSTSGGSTSQSGSSGSGNSGVSSSAGNSGQNASGSGSTSNAGQSASAGNNQSGSSSTESQDTGVSVKKIEDGDSAEATLENEENEEISDETATEENTEITMIESDRGTIYFVPITVGEIGKEQLETIMGQEAYVDFQMKDDSGTVLYAWEFYGMDIQEAFDMDYTIESSTNAFEGCSYGTGSDSLYLHFNHEGKFPAKASIYMQVSEYFSDNQQLRLYLYDETEDTVTLVQENFICENGYVTLELDQGSNYIITTDTFETTQPEDETTVISMETKEDTAQFPVVGIVVIVIATVIVVAGIIVFVKKKKKQG